MKKTKEIIDTIVEALKAELADFEFLSFLHVANIIYNGKTPKPFDNLRFTCVFKAYVYFRTMQEIIRTHKPVKIEAPDQFVIAGAVSALKNTDCDAAHDYVGQMATHSILSDIERVDWMKGFKAGEISVSGLISFIEKELRENVKQAAAEL